ncbi:MAG: hypothetical protein HQ517_08525 [SAR324 cluster bacterium]|nr:hypothetical protein [SAR324 cluster bacterium]
MWNRKRKNVVDAYQLQHRLQERCNAFAYQKIGKDEIDEIGAERVCKSKKVASGYEIQSVDVMPELGVKFFVGQ